MSEAWRMATQVVLIAYTVASPFMFLWFHRNVMKETWNDDFADRVTVRLYVFSNICAQALAYMIEHGEI